MTIAEFARKVIEDPRYFESVMARLNAGQLPEVVEVFLLEEFQLADGKLCRTGVAPVQARTLATPEGRPVQSRTFALVQHPSAPITEVQS